VRLLAEVDVVLAGFLNGIIEGMICRGRLGDVDASSSPHLANLSDDRIGRWNRIRPLSPA
jgi:hypothetical protein